MRVSLIYDRDVEIPMRDGSILRANVYRPDGPGPFPVIMTLGPYGKDRHWADRDQKHARDLGGGPFINWETPDPETWTPKGYVVLRVDGRGTGASPGFLNPLSARQAQDFHDAIEWAGVQPWSNGRVGLLGISYYAMSQWAAAALRPSHLAAIVPWEGASDLYRDFMRHGGMLNNRFMDWWWPNTVLNVQHGADGALSEAERMAATLPSLRKAAAEHVLDDDFYRGWLPDLSAIEVPMLSVGNWGNVGLHLRGNIEGFVQASSEQKWLRIGVGDHIAPFYAPENIALQERFLGFFLKDEDTGWLDEPKVMLAIREPEGVVWRASDAWPPPGTEWTVFALDATSGALASKSPELVASATCVDDVPLTFTMSVDVRTEITGPVALRLWLSSSTTDADVFVRLRAFRVDGSEMLGVSPNGGPTALACGWLRASHRACDNARSLPWRPWHSHDRTEPLTPDEVVPLDIEIWPTSIVIEAGGRLVLEIGSQEFDTSYFVHNDADDRPPSVFGRGFTVHCGGAFSSRLLLPVQAQLPKRGT